VVAAEDGWGLRRRGLGGSGLHCEFEDGVLSRSGPGRRVDDGGRRKAARCFQSDLYIICSVLFSVLKPAFMSWTVPCNATYLPTCDAVRWLRLNAQPIRDVEGERA
jgi:hypothetical protein